VFAVSDGEDYKILGSAKDYKRIFDSDQGPNTGGMGAISPVPFADAEFMRKVEDEIIRPTFKGLSEKGHPYKGFLFLGLMNVNGDPKVIEYNVRMGDPETEVVIPRLQSDLVELFQAVANGKLNEINLEVTDKSAATIMVVSGGYPEEYVNGKEITGIETVSDSIVFHAGTKRDNDTIITNGGRVLAVTSLGDNFEEAIKKSYQNIEKLHFDTMYYRKDIGFDL
jgi:phosphoribosylamine--glycine ligase